MSIVGIIAPHSKKKGGKKTPEITAKIVGLPDVRKKKGRQNWFFNEFGKKSTLSTFMCVWVDGEEKNGGGGK